MGSSRQDAQHGEVRFFHRSRVPRAASLSPFVLVDFSNAIRLFAPLVDILVHKVFRTIKVAAPTKWPMLLTLK